MAYLVITKWPNDVYKPNKIKLPSDVLRYLLLTPNDVYKPNKKKLTSDILCISFHITIAKVLIAHAANSIIFKC